MKKIFSFTVCLAIVFSLFSAFPQTVSAAATSGTCGANLTWSFDEESGTLTISGTGDMYDYGTAGNYSPWYNYRSGITSIDIGDDVTSIGNYAFYNCKSLTSVTIPDGVTEIRTGAFSFCSSLMSIEIPDGVTEIETYVFYCCGSLLSVNIGIGVTSIKARTFNNCSSLESITVDGRNPVYHSSGNCLIETASKTLIRGCYSSIIPSDGSVTSIGGSAFSDCTSLTSIEIPDSVTDIGYEAFYSCTSLKSIEIPESVTTIHGWAFRRCTSLASILIPNGVTSLGDLAFSECSSIESITAYDNNTVYHSDGNCLIETESKTLIVGCKNSIIPSDGSVTTIGKDAFYGCTSLTSITIPDSVTSIERHAFYDCESLTSIAIPDSVTSIGYQAFYKCKKLSSIYYYGTESEWDKISIASGNDALKKCVIYNAYCVLNGHDYEEVITPPTCSEDGYTTHTCVRCGDSYITDETGALGHDYLGVVTEPACTEDGYTTYTCTRCGDSYVTDETDALGHDFSEYIETVGTSCTEHGYDVYKCVRCEATEQRNFTDALGHDYKGSVTAPTCTEKGYTTYTCSRCGNSYISDQTNPLGHNYSSVVTKPTCTKGGYTTYTCSRCGDSYTADRTEALGHNAITVKENVIEHTCNEDGSYDIVSRCARCGVELSRERVIVPASHTIVRSEIPATCTEDGIFYEKCSVCGTLFDSGIIKAFGHTAVVDGAVEPGCITMGLTEGSHCSVCGEVLVSQKTIPALGHDTYDVITEPTCTESGLIETNCGRCGEKLVETVTEPLGHDVLREEKIPDCTKGGMFIEKCRRCNITLDAGEIPPGEHNYVYTAPPHSCTEGGYAIYKCDRCGKSYTGEWVAALGHDFEDEFTYDFAPTDSAPGQKSRHCTRCDAVTDVTPLVDVPHGKCGEDLTWLVDVEAETIAIIGTGDMEDYSINYNPFTGSSVTSAPWGQYYSLIDTVKLSFGVSSIGDRAFSGYTSLTSVTIPDSVTSIGSGAFYNCTSLTSITIPSSVTSIGDDAISWCIGIESIIVESGNSKYHSEGNCLIETESKTLIRGCKNSIIPSDGSVTSVGDYAFSCCIFLESINIPDGVTTIGDYAFEGCDKLTNVVISDSVESIGGFSFLSCGSLTSITIPRSLSSISNCLFYDCTSLKSIVIYNGITSIRTSAFYGCNSLTDVYYCGTEEEWNVITIESGNEPLLDATIHFNPKPQVEFSGTCGEKLTWSLITDSGVLTITGAGDMYDYAANYDTFQYFISSTAPWADHCSSIKTVNISPEVTSIGGAAFAGCTELTSINIPDGVTKIRGSAFSFCASLTSIDIPDCVTSIGGAAFRGCSSLKSITIPDGVTSIGAFAFYCCSKLETVTIPEDMSEIGAAAFYGCNSLTDVYYCGTEEEWNAITIESGNDPLLDATLHCTVGPQGGVTVTCGGTLLGTYEPGEVIELPVPETVNENGATKRFFTWIGAEVTRSDYDASNGTPNGRKYTMTVPEGDVELTAEYVYVGDINGDGLITVTDISVMKSMFAGSGSPDDRSLEAADINFDGLDTLTDLSLFKSMLAG